MCQRASAIARTEGISAGAARGPEGRRPAVPRPRASETTSSAQGPCRPGQWQQASPAWASSFPCSTSSDLLPSSVLRTTPPLATRWLRTCGASAPRSEHYIRLAECQSVRCDSRLHVSCWVVERRCRAVHYGRCSPMICRRQRDLDERDDVRRRPPRRERRTAPRTVVGRYRPLCAVGSRCRGSSDKPDGTGTRGGVECPVRSRAAQPGNCWICTIQVRCDVAFAAAHAAVGRRNGQNLPFFGGMAFAVPMRASALSSISID